MSFIFQSFAADGIPRARLEENCAGRLGGFVLPGQVSQGGGPVHWRVSGRLILEPVAMQSLITMAQEHGTNGPAMFWAGVGFHQFPNINHSAIVWGCGLLGGAYAICCFQLLPVWSQCWKKFGFFLKQNCRLVVKSEQNTKFTIRGSCNGLVGGS